MTDMSKLRIGVVGVGYLGSFHAEKYADMDAVSLIGVADIDKQRAREVAKRLGTTAFTDYRDLVGRVDAVSIAVPTPLHYRVSRDFLENDIDVLIEKPMTTTVDEADRLLDIAGRRGRIVQVGHLERFNPAVVALRDIVKVPRFIESHRLSLYKARCNDVSVVLDLMIHDIDIILNFVMSEIRSIHAAGMAVVSGHVDIANARLEFENGCVANVTASRISAKNERKIRLFQRDAYISVDFANHDITVVRKEEDTCGAGELPMEPPDGQTVPPVLGLIPGMAIHQLSFARGDALAEELRSFVAAVAHHRTPTVTGQMGRDALKIAVAIMEQIRSSRGQLLDG